MLFNLQLRGKPDANGNALVVESRTQAGASVEEAVRCCLKPPPHIRSTSGPHFCCNTRHHWRRWTHPRNKNSRAPRLLGLGLPKNEAPPSGRTGGAIRDIGRPPPGAGDIERTLQRVVNSAWSLHLTRTTRYLTRCLSNVRFREIMMRCVMRRKIGAAIAALLLLSGSSLMSFAQTGGSPSAGQKGVAGSPKAEGIGSTSSTHNPSGSSSSTTGMENRTGTGSDMGTNTSTHNPAGKKD